MSKSARATVENVLNVGGVQRRGLDLASQAVARAHGHGRLRAQLAPAFLIILAPDKHGNNILVHAVVDNQAADCVLAIEPEMAR